MQKTGIKKGLFLLFKKRRGNLASSLLNCKQKKYGPEPEKIGLMQPDTYFIKFKTLKKY